MSNRIMNTITISCVLLGSSSTVMASQKPITVEKIAKEYQSYIVDYKDYPSARRSELTQHLLATIEAGKEISVPKKSEVVSSE